MATEIQASHLIYTVAPRVTDATEAQGHLVTLEERIDLRVAFAEGWIARKPAPAPVEEPSLGDLIQQARQRLRADRVAADTTELDHRRRAVLLVREGLSE